MPDNPNYNMIRPLGSEFIDKDGNRIRVIERKYIGPDVECACCYTATTCKMYKTHDEHSRGACGYPFRSSLIGYVAFELVKVHHINFMEE